jgi:hypothetical protein
VELSPTLARIVLSAKRRATIWMAEVRFPVGTTELSLLHSVHTGSRVHPLPQPVHGVVLNSISTGTVSPYPSLSLQVYEVCSSHGAGPDNMALLRDNLVYVYRRFGGGGG